MATDPDTYADPASPATGSDAPASAGDHWNAGVTEPAPPLRDASGHVAGAADSRDAPAASILGRLRDQYERSLASRTVILRLPWLDDMWARFTPVDVADYEQARKANVRTVEDDLVMTADSIAKHCVEILVGPDADHTEPLRDVIERETGRSLSGPVRFDSSLAELFGMQGYDRQRQIVLGLLTRPEDKLPFTAFAEQLLRWSRGESGKAVDDVVGE